MSHQIQYFDEVQLPLYNPSQDHSPSGSESALSAGAGGYFDKYGSGDSRAALEPIVVTGVVIGEIEYWVDEDGDYVVDEDGGAIYSGSDATVLRSRLAALKAKVKKRGTLWRVRLDDGVREWKTARFLRMSQPQQVQDRVFKAHVTCTFESTMSAWRAESPNTYTTTTTPTASGVVVAENPGETVNDAVVTVTCTSGTITRVDFINDELGVWWEWATGSLAAGSSLVVDAGSQGVNVTGSVGAFDSFLLNGSSAGWMPIPQGIWPFEIRVEGGNANVQLQFYPQNS